jgi:hypothetical protein
MKTARMLAHFATIGFLAAATPSQANIIEFDFSNAGAFSGVGPSNSSGVYAKAIFDDGGGSGSVTLTMSVLNNLLAGAYVNDWYFNINPTLGAPTVTFNSGTAANTVDKGQDCCKPDGSGQYDLAFHFDTSNPGELARGTNSVYTLALAGLTANSFDFFSTAPSDAGHGPFEAAVHVQGYSNSVWLAPGDTPIPPTAIPEPTTLALLGLAMLGVGVSRRRRPV